ncbi:hypothetical protein D3C75_1076160 [compost metagenome]
MWTVNADPRIVDAKDTSTQLQRQEVQADQQHPLMIVPCLLNVLQAADAEPALDTPVGPEPGHAGFKQPHPHGFEVLGDQRITFGSRHIRKAQFQVTLSYRSPAFEETH